MHRAVGRMLLVSVLVGMAAVSCTDDAGSGSAGDRVTTPPPSATGVPSATNPQAAEPTTSTPSSVTVATNPPTIETITPVEEDGVPGIDSDDPFCRAWSEFAGSFQALALASGLGVDPAAAARAEVIASGAVVSAVGALADEFPDAIISERDVFVNDVIGPFTRRAERASAELRVAGLSPVEIASLGDLWLVALVEAGVDDPEIDVVVPDDAADAVAGATDAFSADVPTIVADPSLVTQAQATATFEYLATNCPDQGILAGNDAIG